LNNHVRLATAFDINLLNIFDAVYTFGSVTTAAANIGVSPASVSKSLQKLRDYFSDPLFVRKGMSLSPTATAHSIYSNLAEKHHALINSIVDLSCAKNRNTLTVHCSAYFGMRILTHLSKWLEENNPECKIIHKSLLHENETGEDLLTLHGVDLSFDIVPAFNRSITTHLLCEEKVTFICRKDHPRLGSTFSREEASQENFAVLTLTGDNLQFGKNIIESMFGERKIFMQSNSLMTIISIVEKTETIAVIPTWLLERVNSCYGIRALGTEFELKRIPIYMMFRKTMQKNTLLSGLTNHITHLFPLMTTER
jgi:DNA-binding transcriptional LysR family regulator